MITSCTKTHLKCTSFCSRNCLFKWCSTRFWSRRYRSVSSDLKVPSIPTLYIDNAAMYYILFRPVVDPMILQTSVMNYFYRLLPAHQCERATRLGTLIPSRFQLAQSRIADQSQKTTKGGLEIPSWDIGIIDDATLNRSPCLCSM